MQHTVTLLKPTGGHQALAQTLGSFLPSFSPPGTAPPLPSQDSSQAAAEGTSPRDNRGTTPSPDLRIRKRLLRQRPSLGDPRQPRPGTGPLRAASPRRVLSHGEAARRAREWGRGGEAGRPSRGRRYHNNGERAATPWRCGARASSASGFSRRLGAGPARSLARWARGVCPQDPEHLLGAA